MITDVIRLALHKPILMPEPTHRASIDDRTGMLATVFGAPLVATLATLAFGWAIFDTPRPILIVSVAFVSGLIGASSGEPFFDALIRSIIALPFVIAIWWFSDLSHWIPQLLIAMLTSVCVAGLAFGSFRDITGR